MKLKLKNFRTKIRKDGLYGHIHVFWPYRKTVIVPVAKKTAAMPLSYPSAASR
jgi:hypothetical protein